MTEAWSTVWSAHERARIERLCAVLTGDPTVAGDLAQETLLQAWRIRHRLVDPAGSRPWLDAVARNVCRRWQVDRARRLAHEHPTDADPPPQGYDPITTFLERHELVDLLDRALALLPADTRAALVGRYVEDRSTQELADALGATTEAVSMRLVRGRARLRELLETELAGEPLAEAWRSRYGVGWRSTRLHCPECGGSTVTWRRDDVRGVVELRCRTCTPGDVSSAYRLDNPALAPHLRDVWRPSTVVSRMARWSAGFWPSAIGGRPVSCTRCARPVRASVYRRPMMTDARTARGWQVHCDACGEQLSSSLGGLKSEFIAFSEASETSEVGLRGKVGTCGDSHRPGFFTRPTARPRAVRLRGAPGSRAQPSPVGGHREGERAEAPASAGPVESQDRRRMVPAAGPACRTRVRRPVGSRRGVSRLGRRAGRPGALAEPAHRGTVGSTGQIHR